MMNKLKYIYGPVYSWRLGRSLGIDPISDKAKICNFDCIYCQLGRTKVFESHRQVFVPTQEIIQEINSLKNLSIDYLTFSGRGEPTLAENLGEMIYAVKQMRPEKVAVITNASLLFMDEVQSDLSQSDFVLAKLDASSQDGLASVDGHTCGILFEDIVEGIKSFQNFFKGKLALQMMFVAENQMFAKDMAEIARAIDPDEVELNTPLRPSGVKPLNADQMFEIKKLFYGLKASTVYEVEKKPYTPMDDLETTKRHGNFKKEILGAY